MLRRADEIIDAAARVFAERGYHGTSTQAIADVLGMRQASLYYYFPSKEAALELVCERGVDGFVRECRGDRRRRRHAAREARPPDRRRTSRPTTTKRDYVKVFINERRYLPDASRRRIGRKSRRIERCFEEVIRAGIADGSIRAGTDVAPRHAGRARHVQQRDQLARRPTRAQDVGRIAAEFGELVVARPAVPAPGAAQRSVRRRVPCMRRPDTRSRSARRPAPHHRAGAAARARARAARRGRVSRQEAAASTARRTWAQYAVLVARAAKGLAALGWRRGDRIAIMADACEEWLICDLAAQSLGAIVYGIYPTASAEEVEYQMRDGGAVLFVAEDQEYVDKILPLADRLPAAAAHRGGRRDGAVRARARQAHHLAAMCAARRAMPISPGSQRRLPR